MHIEFHVLFFYPFSCSSLYIFSFNMLKHVKLTCKIRPDIQMRLLLKQLLSICNAFCKRIIPFLFIFLFFYSLYLCCLKKASKKLNLCETQSKIAHWLAFLRGLDMFNWNHRSLLSHRFHHRCSVVCCVSSLFLEFLYFVVLAFWLSFRLVSRVN